MDEVLRRVLVIDHSRVVRSALAKHLRDHFEVREEADGESAWQTLVLDPSIIAVVSGAQLSRLSGYDLLARLRINKLRRLCDIPFLLVISGHETESDRQRAREHGVTDFIERGMPRQEILARIGRLVNWELANDLAPLPPPSRAGNAANKAAAGKAPAGVIDAGAIGHRLENALALQASTSGMVGVIAFNLDNHADLVTRFGWETASAVAAHVAHVLQTKVGQGDSIGHDERGLCLIISPGTSLASCTAFAQRVCRGLANSQVGIGGEFFTLQVSAGIAGMPADAERSAAELIALASQRLALAQSAGGNRVVNDDGTAPGLGFRPEYFTELLRFYCPQTANLQLGAVGLHLMPLLKTLDREFRFGLPLHEIERSFERRAREEHDGR